MSKFKFLNTYGPVLTFCFLGALIYSNTFHSSFHLDDNNSIINNLAVIPNFAYSQAGEAKFAPKGLHDKIREDFVSFCKASRIFLTCIGRHYFVQPQNLGYPAKPVKFSSNLTERPLASLEADFPALRAEKSGITGPVNLKAIWNFWPTRFATYLSIAFNYHFNRLDVFGYHLVNLIIHLCTAILVWWFVLLITNNKARFMAFFAGLIFLAHPIQTQSVTYIIQRATSLAALFYMASLALYIKSREGSAPHIRRICYAGSLAALVMAMFSKENTITLPFMILLCEYFFLKKKEGINWKRLIPFFAAISIIPLTMLLTKSIDFQVMGRVSELPTPISPWHYLLTQFRVIATYTRLLLVPFNQNVDYDYAVSRSFFEPQVFASFSLIILMLIAAIWLRSRHRMVSFSIFWFFLTLLPESSIVPIKDVIFEHRLYLPMVGYAIFLTSVKPSKIMVAALSVIVVCYSASTYARNFVWKDEFTLWNDAAQKSPNKARPLNNLGLAYAEKGNPDQAIASYNKALEMDPNYYLAYNNLGIAYRDKGDFNKAIFNLTKAIEMNPNYAIGHNNRGCVYKDNGEHDKAISDYNQAIRISPSYAEAYNNLGLVYKNKKDFKSAINIINKAIQLKPDYAAAYNNRSVAYRDIGDFDRAIVDCDKAIKIDPSLAVAYRNRAIAYFYKGECDKSWEDVHKAEALGDKVPLDFLEELRKFSER